MNIQYNNNSFDNFVTFKSHGKPLELKYIVEKRSNLLPNRVLQEAKQILARKEGEMPSLLDLHKEIYSKLKDCQTLTEAQRYYPEFSGIKTDIIAKRNSIVINALNGQSIADFALKMLQDVWVNLKNKDDIAQSMGLKSRSSFDWLLKAMNFVQFTPNYKVLLRASDSELNNEISSKTKAWNSLHPEEMRKRNKFAAQACKKEEYKIAQSERIQKYDKEHPERKEKIAKHSKAMWDLAPEVKSVMANFLNANPYVKGLFKKKLSGKRLTTSELRACNGFFKDFWKKNPKLKEKLSNAAKLAKETN